MGLSAVRKTWAGVVNLKTVGSVACFVAGATFLHLGSRCWRFQTSILWKGCNFCVGDIIFGGVHFRCKDMEVKNANRGGTVRSKFACNSLQLSNLKEVSKKMLVFKIQLPNWEKVSERQPDRKTNIQVDRQTDR